MGEVRRGVEGRGFVGLGVEGGVLFPGIEVVEGDDAGEGGENFDLRIAEAGRVLGPAKADEAALAELDEEVAELGFARGRDGFEVEAEALPDVVGGDDDGGGGGFEAGVVVETPKGEGEEGLGLVEAGEQAAVAGNGPELKDGAVGIGDEFEVERGEVFGELDLIVPGEEVEFAVAAGVAEEGAVGEEFGEDVGDGGAVVVADAVPGGEGGPGEGHDRGGVRRVVRG